MAHKIYCYGLSPYGELAERKCSCALCVYRSVGGSNPPFSAIEKEASMQKVNVLGTEYTIIDKTEKEDERLKKYDGYCDSSTKTIVLLKYEDDPMNKEDMSYFRKQILRHEIIHAFVSESGLEASGHSFGGSWAQNEEMVDWIAIQAPKLFAAFSEVDAIELPTHTNTCKIKVDVESIAEGIRKAIAKETIGQKVRSYLNTAVFQSEKCPGGS